MHEYGTRDYHPLFGLHLNTNRSLCVSFVVVSDRFKIPESTEIDTVLGNLTVFEHLENKVGIKLYLVTANTSVFNSSV